MFRSDYEICVAKLLDALEIKWEYETQTWYINETCEYYTPDFWLPEIGTILEIKGGRQRERLHKPYLLQRYFQGRGNDEWGWQAGSLVVFVVTPESMWTICDSGGLGWCDEVALVTSYCCGKWMFADPHGLWHCRYCRESGKYDQYVMHRHWDTRLMKGWGRLYDPVMKSWQPLEAIMS